MQVNSISEEFVRAFTIKLAITQAEKEEVYRIRHQVYCCELNWEPESPLKQEKDKHDANAQHLLLKHNESGKYIGCNRLITSPAGKNEILPCANFLSENLSEQHRNLFAQASIGEASRFAILPQIRKKESGALQINQRVRPFMSTGMYLSNLALAKLLGMEGVLILVSPKLARRVGMLGLGLTKISQDIEHKGSRAVYFLPVEQSPYLLKSNPKLIELYDTIKASVSSQLNGLFTLNQAK
ncbi:PEP-CTERM/exosortase system-associated acyltransferase [Pseudoalteromonas luteoviolacea]|uniref:PEP-CTERM/exosortase system-associated acyltransferase n=1 Tax=Pseudoalteromonas luteoviolacea DSM 6061 TaxID=1365250 RepID=A0A166YVU6_9GAMM|nr:PEP-CTERM/exosortase system-associated acyltransferase [Pseudoalteromonas luteoviolacea]KZN43573.1 hypothetical protein N475_08365 [Pseudoalteromonas luteoviolacea DSM 6061]MBE0386546.1 hypothetical protein [Pseudoalteromonas luteoviolacea DSM 6061]